MIYFLPWLFDMVI
ncbi:hypothetical protein F383_29571 [Gossypium arboreum]|uniref:Uncharacterized protein n=1 Tax=Gossypium arboreum TaxID=29729 RepID=A0A0B0MZA3_GOSAR|nr:hypothetical protein F383_29571 [Gossypium arboreum]